MTSYQIKQQRDQRGKDRSAEKPQKRRRNVRFSFARASAGADYPSRLAHERTVFRGRNILAYEKICLLDNVAFYIPDYHQIFSVCARYHSYTSPPLRYHVIICRGAEILFRRCQQKQNFR